MAHVRSKTPPKKHREPLPEHFGSIEEAAEFWDTHDSADYEESMQDVECEIDLKRRHYLISVDRDLYHKVQSIAHAQGISTETLLNLWIQEKVS